MTIMVRKTYLYFSIICRNNITTRNKLSLLALIDYANLRLVIAH